MEKNDSKHFSTILSEDPEKKITDIVYLIDSTSSMLNYIQAAKNQAENISKDLRELFPETNFQYGYIFYRDPIDSEFDIHEIINLTDDVDSLPELIGKIKAYGGGDCPEDWAGAYKKANDEIKWRNGNRVIIHIADAGAHGRRFTIYDEYFEEEDKLLKELDECIKKKIKIFGYVIKLDCRNSFNECKKYYQSKGGIYEIFNFEKSKYLNYYNNYDYYDYNEYDDYNDYDDYDDYDDEDEYECESDDNSDIKKKKKKTKSIKCKTVINKSNKMDYQNIIDHELRKLVIKSIARSYGYNINK